MTYRVLAIGGVRFVSFVSARARRSPRSNVTYPLSSHPIQLVVSTGRGVAFARRDDLEDDHDVTDADTDADTDATSLDLFVDVSNAGTDAETESGGADDYEHVECDDYDELWHDVVDETARSGDAEWAWGGAREDA